MITVDVRKGTVTVAKAERSLVVQRSKAGVDIVARGPQGAQGPQGPGGATGGSGAPGDLTKPVADALYEPKSTLLRSAAWWVDAGAVSAGVYANLLTPNQASLETDLAGMITNQTLVPLDRPVTGGYHGSAFARMTVDGNASGAYLQGAEVPVVAGRPYTLAAHVKFTGSTAHVRWCVYAVWWDAGHGYITEGTDAWRTDRPTDWSAAQAVLVAPAGAAFLMMRLVIENTITGGDTMDVDGLGIWEGRGGVWAMPGYPITGGEPMQLDDLTGKGRPAVFGVGAARPTVLPFTGQKYLHVNRSTANWCQGAHTAMTPDMNLDTNFEYRVQLRQANWRAPVIQTGNGVMIGRWQQPAQAGGAHSMFGFEDYSGGRLRYAQVSAALDSSCAVTSTAATTFGPGEVGWVRVQVAANIATFAESRNGTVWTQVGDPLPLPGPGAPGAAAPGMRIGGYDAGDQSLSADYYRAAFGPIGGPPVVSWSAEDMTGTGGVSGGRDWSIGRYWYGDAGEQRYPVLVDRPIIQFHGNQFAATDTLADVHMRDFTAVVAVRHHYADGYGYRPWGTYLGNRNSTGADNGFDISRANITAYERLFGLVGGDAAAPYAYGAKNERVLAFRRKGNLWLAFSEGVPDPNGPWTTYSVGSPSPQGLVVGAMANSSGSTAVNGAEIEFVGAAVFDRALTDAEVAQVSAELGSTVEVGTVQTTHPNGDDVLVRVWTGFGWQTIHYDSGVRQIDGLLTLPAGWTLATYGVRVRRVGSTVTLGLLDGLHSASTSGSEVSLWALPVGWRGNQSGGEKAMVPSRSMDIATHAWIFLGGYYGTQVSVKQNMAGDVHNGFALSWETTDPIPVGLPGTLISPAPAY